MVALTFGIGMIPPLGGDITAMGMKIIGVFIGVLYGWTFLGFFWTSCFGMLALALTGYKDITSILAEGFGSAAALQVLILFILVAYLIDSGFVELATGFFVTRKFAIGRPFILVFMILYGCGFVNMLGLGFGGVFFVWAIMYKMFDLLGYKKGDMLVTFWIYGGAICAALANAVFPFVTFPILFKGWLAPLGVTIPDAGWLIWNLVYFTVFMILYVLTGKYILRLNVEPFIARADEVAAVYKQQSATKQQKIACGMVLLFLFITLSPSFLPDGTIKTYLAQYGLLGATLLLVTITSFIYIEGKPLTDWSKCARQGVNWDLVIMFVATTPIANALESGDAGILTTVFSIVLPVIENMGPFLYTLCVLAFFLIFTQFAHNVVLVIAFAPTLLALGADIGVNVAFMSAMICVVAQTAFLTPGASSPAAAVHSNTDWIDVKQAYVMGIVAILISVCSVAITYPLGLVVF